MQHIPEGLGFIKTQFSVAQFLKVHKNTIKINTNLPMSLIQSQGVCQCKFKDGTSDI